jgi:hypothetical protein
MRLDEPLPHAEGDEFQGRKQWLTFRWRQRAEQPILYEAFLRRGGGHLHVLAAREV